MPASYRKIDYALRPAKHTERRMLCDMLRKLSVFASLPSYTYVGFGGIAFTDFVLFHKSLGIHKMISLEETYGAHARLENNKPFNAISIVNKPASWMLPRLSWENPHVLWLDYDDPLKPSMLQDVTTVANHARSGTALAVSFQCSKAFEVKEAEGDTDSRTPMERFRANFERGVVPEDADEADLTGWSFGNLGEHIFLSEIQSVLANRNVALSADEQLTFHLVSSIQYNDNAFMHTTFGIFISEQHKDKLEQANFSDLDFLPTNKKVKIDVPKLTLREIKFLEKQLPLADGQRLNHSDIPAADAKNFKKLYRYLPNFTVLEN